jgi:predicted dienelactone hydrolase
LGMLIGAALRSSGKVVIVMGGATQVLFGICGARWISHPVIRSFWNSEWVWPSASETPAGAGKIEGGCYWKGVDGAQRGAT